MTEQESMLSRPRQFLTNALKAVRGDNTQELVEAFTSEMTLVAEGLCEDQSRIRSAASELESRMDKLETETGNELRHLEKSLDTYIEKSEKQFQELRGRLDQIEKECSKSRQGPKIGKLHLPTGFMSQLIVLVAIAAGAWVIVNILQLFR